MFLTRNKYFGTKVFGPVTFVKTARTLSLVRGFLLRGFLAAR
jgi:hypothetical protein